MNQIIQNRHHLPCRGVRNLLFCACSMVTVLLLLYPDTTSAQRATRSIDRDTIRTGDIFTYQVLVTGVEAYDEVIYPDSADFGSEFDILDTSIEPIPRGDSLAYTLQFFGVDVHAIPELYAKLINGSDTLFLIIPEQRFIYESRVEDTEAELRPLKPIFPFFRNWWPVILLVIAVAAIMGYLLYRYRERLFVRPEPKPVQKVEIEPFHNPLKELRDELDRIEDEYTRPHLNAKPYYTDLGDAFRRYFEHTHNFPALESTTFEVIQQLQRQQCDQQVIQLVSDILQQADLVKFAKFQPNVTDCRDVIKNCNILAERIAITDKPKIAALREEHEKRQLMKQKRLSEEDRYDLG